MKVKDYYSCVVRIDVGDADPALMDAELQLSGEHSHVVRSASKYRRALDFHRWEYPTVDGGAYDDWSSLEDALATHVAPLLPAHATLSPLGAIDKAHWWCGCFHDNPPSLVYLSANLVAQLALLGIPLHLDNYFPSSESPFAAVDPGDDPSVDEPVEFNHAYRFWLSRPGGDAEQYIEERAGDGTIPVWHVFADGLEHTLAGLGRDRGSAAGRMLVCEHVQYAFDGGPVFHQADFRCLAELGLGVAIVWKL
jgi:hypothetical protein